MRPAVVFDLDDTLIKEVDFLKSGFRAVARLVEERFGLDSIQVYWKMLSWYNNNENVFIELNNFYGLSNPIEDYLNVYRFHLPEISLDDETREILNTLRGNGVEMGIVSDGRYKTQMNKVKALRLADWIDENCIIVNDQEHFKPSHIGFDKLEHAMYAKTGDSELSFTYVGDNPQKDFICPNQKLWNTICLLDDGRNIHQQDFNTVPGDAMPKMKVKSLSEILHVLL